MKAQTTTIIISAATLLLSTSLMSGNVAASSGCKSVSVYAMGYSGGLVGKFRNRRAERRANKAWENKVEKAYGPKYADLDKATYIERSSSGITRDGDAVHMLTASFQFCG